MRANCDAGAPIDPIPTEYPQRQVLDGEISVRRVRALHPAFSGGFVRRVDRHHVGSLDIWIVTRSDRSKGAGGLTETACAPLQNWYLALTPYVRGAPGMPKSLPPAPSPPPVY